MSLGVNAAKQFIQGIFIRENFIEFVVYNSSLFLLSMYIGNVIDNALNWVYTKMEENGIIKNKDSNVWLLFTIVFQLVFTSAVSYTIKLFLLGTMLSFSSDTTVYDHKAVGIIYAFITFYAQDNLKKRLAKVNKLMDRK
jgi:uncharacterized BrkB/YihY/UPF0761 family membrane protein